MIKFFRKIRQKLLVENRFNKYLLYAIGEIILVVIGILIALQINNWNEEKKLEKEEKKIIKSLKKEITGNLIQLETEIKEIKIIIGISTKLIKQNDEIQKNKYVVSEILGALGYNTNKTEKSILNEILNTNSRSLISNDSILIQLKSLKSKFEKNEKTQFYVDEFWNTEVIHFMNQKGLGVYFPSFRKKLSKQKVIEVDAAFFSLVGIMNGYQEALLYSREDLKEKLLETMNLLSKN